MILLFRGRSFISWRIRMATLSPYSHAAWSLVTPAQRENIRRFAQIARVYDGGVLANELIRAGSIEAWQKGGVQERRMLTDGHKGGTLIDVYDLPDMPDDMFENITKSLRLDLGKDYWFGGILLARFNRFLKAVPPGFYEPGGVRKFFCSHLIETHLRLFGYGTADEVPSWGVWPGMMSYSLRTKRLCTIRLPEEVKLKDESLHCIPAGAYA